MISLNLTSLIDIANVVVLAVQAFVVSWVMSARNGFTPIVTPRRPAPADTAMRTDQLFPVTPFSAFPSKTPTVMRSQDPYATPSARYEDSPSPQLINKTLNITQITLQNGPTWGFRTDWCSRVRADHRVGCCGPPTLNSAVDLLPG